MFYNEAQDSEGRRIEEEDVNCQMNSELRQKHPLPPTCRLRNRALVYEQAKGTLNSMTVAEENCGYSRLKQIVARERSRVLTLLGFAMDHLVMCFRR